MSFLKKLFRRKPTEAEAAACLIARMKELRPTTEFEYVANEKVIRLKDGTISLANFYVDFVRADDAERATMINTFALGMLPVEYPADLAAARPNILAALRHLGGLDIARIASDIEDAEKIRDGLVPLSEYLVVAPVYDTEHGIASLSRTELAKWGLSPEQAIEIAVENLRHKAPSTFREVIPGLYQSNYGDYYDAARILVHEHVHQLGLAGNPVAMVPNRTCLLIASDRDDKALCGMIRIAEHYLTEESRPLSDEMLRLVDGRWTPWVPETGEAGAELMRLQKEQTAREYDVQKGVLDQQIQRKGIDLHVASHTLMRKENGALWSYAVLTQGVDTWLPTADVVMLVDLSEPTKPHLVTWQTFQREAGHLLERLPYTRPLYKVTSHPDVDTISRMEVVSL
jgi:hypothetical protein